MISTLEAYYEVRKGFLNLLACIGVVFSSQTRTIAEWKERTD